MLPGHVALVGLMGSGKSTIGALVARRLRVPFVDLDAMLIGRYGSIESIFAVGGEEHFRRLEHEIFCDVLAGEPAIISTGGGIVTYEPNRELLAKLTTIYLDVSLPILVGRLKRSATVRPLVGPDPSLERIEALSAARAPFYRRATHVVKADNEVRAIVSEIVDVLKPQHRRRSIRNK